MEHWDTQQQVVSQCRFLSHWDNQVRNCPSVVPVQVVGHYTGTRLSQCTIQFLCLSQCTIINQKKTSPSASVPVFLSHVPVSQRVPVSGCIFFACRMSQLRTRALQEVHNKPSSSPAPTTTTTIMIMRATPMPKRHYARSNIV